MISLFLSTATKRVIVSIFDNDKLLYSFNEYNDNTLSERIMPIVDNAYKGANITPNDVDNIYVVNGPGSFTGIRVGVTIAKVMAWTLNKKIIPVSSLQMLSSTSFSSKYIVPLIDARRDYVYTGMYDSNLNQVIEDKHILLDDFMKKINKDDVTFVTEDDFNFDTIISDYNILSLIKKHCNDNGINPHEVNPNYLKLTEAEEKFLASNDK